MIRDGTPWLPLWSFAALIPVIRKGVTQTSFGAMLYSINKFCHSLTFLPFQSWMCSSEVVGVGWWYSFTEVVILGTLYCFNVFMLITSMCFCGCLSQLLCLDYLSELNLFPLWNLLLTLLPRHTTTGLSLCSLLCILRVYSWSTRR